MKYPSTPKIIAEEMASPGMPEEAAYSDNVLIRRAIIAELDAINLYDQIANFTKDTKIKELMLSISREEKVHMGELEQLLDNTDDENSEATQEGRDEAEG